MNDPITGSAETARRYKARFGVEAKRVVKKEVQKSYGDKRQYWKEVLKRL